MKETDGFDHDTGIGIIHYPSYQCPDCGFEIPFDNTQSIEQLQKEWEEYIIESEIYIPI